MPLIGCLLLKSGVWYHRPVNAELFSFVVVADDNEYEDKSQWNNDPKRIDTPRLGVQETSCHGCCRVKEE